MGGAARLGELAARGPLQIVPAARVADEMRRLGIRPAHLISPSQTVTVGRQVGADAVLTGRVTHLMVERERDDPPRSFASVVARVDVDVRVLEVGTRLNLFQDTFICQVVGVPLVAMECVVRDVAHRLGLQSLR